MAVCRKSVLWGAAGGLLGSVLMWTVLHLTERNRGKQIVTAGDFISSSSQQGFFLHKGKAVAPQHLSAELKINFERALNLRMQTIRDAELQFYKEADKIARLHILEKQLAVIAAKDGKSTADAEQDLLPREEVSTQDARDLYEASDPSAPREGFAPVKGQLMGYLNEVRRREALETWTNGLRTAGEWKLLIERPMPLPELSSVNLEGLPVEGKSQPNALVFVDYLCESCVPFLVDFAKLLNEHRASLRPVYVPFPYTRPEVSMALARGSLCAQQLGEFSSFHMAALTKGELLSEVSVFDLVRQTDMRMSEFRACYRSGEGLAELLARAQALARQFGLMRTPAVVFQGQLLEGENISEQLWQLLKSGDGQGQLTKRDSDNKRQGSSQP